MTPTLRSRVIYERNYVIEHGDVFFCLMPFAAVSFLGACRGHHSSLTSGGQA